MPSNPPTSLFDPKRILALALYVITRPADYFRTMPRTGALAEPLVFASAMAVVSALLAALIMLAGGGARASLLDILVTVPLMTIGAAFIVGGILFLVWKLLGSQQRYETAFRCVTATLAINPLTVIINLIPYLGILVGIAWTSYLLVVASVEVHGIARRKAAITFTVLGVLLAGSALVGEYSSRQFSARLEAMGITQEEFSQMSADEIRAVVEKMLQPELEPLP
ncbi:hypothetical protein D8I35_13635 [Corticibacter populi]|uniref:Yip1 domain-containing protein n=1 Tax=Corticibacter populi TaxID=1550736 RepID=A0A3M6QPC6_9BURK|nr:YIP1 family protein [Corticibacter populi]RMX04897.1 hypothetical protein D8I35_13635 [Corticibacter populi]RZS33680.1 hypothetical protein EV687_2006 [Corticibacter populi]